MTPIPSCVPAVELETADIWAIDQTICAIHGARRSRGGSFSHRASVRDSAHHRAPSDVRSRVYVRQFPV